MSGPRRGSRHGSGGRPPAASLETEVSMQGFPPLGPADEEAVASLLQDAKEERGSAAEPLLVHTIGHAGGVEPPESPLIALPTSLEDRDAARRARRQLTVATVLCFIFMGAEVVGGYYANSLAIMTDAAHLLSDVAGLLISLFSLWLSTKSPTIDVHTFGFHRVEIIGALAGVLLIWALTGVLVWEAIGRVRNPEDVDGKIMFIVACSGLVVNLSMMKVLHQGHGHSHSGGHGHSHGGSDAHEAAPAGPYGSGGDDHHHHGHSHAHSHGHGHGEEDGGGEGGGSNAESLSVRAAFIHAVGDLLQSIGVCVAAGLIWYDPVKFRIADPICTFVFSVLVLWSTLGLLKTAFMVLLNAVPKHISTDRLLTQVAAVRGVIDIHDFHVWSIASGKAALAVHLVADEGKGKTILPAVQRICAAHGIRHATVQIEEGRAAMEECMAHNQVCSVGIETGKVAALADR